MLRMVSWSTDFVESYGRESRRDSSKTGEQQRGGIQDGHGWAALRSMHEHTHVANHPKAEQGLCQRVAKVTGPPAQEPGLVGAKGAREVEGGLDAGFSAGLGQEWAHPSTAFTMQPTWGPACPTACGGCGRCGRCTADYSLVAATARPANPHSPAWG
ncbi:hypothetical protein AOQ84DRAFT_368426 [Glonium stellatum]|uniref:Uncharacterized protein n=1 Tax=Glonium stellatum TaxID=574774 RepID=A0A8E2ES67_9PEZI|nr:hypothetical protein AOQ84DRAFT_368426 [Glonium stellatum]